SCCISSLLLFFLFFLFLGFFFLFSSLLAKCSFLLINLLSINACNDCSSNPSVIYVSFFAFAYVYSKRIFSVFAIVIFPFLALTAIAIQSRSFATQKAAK